MEIICIKTESVFFPSEKFYIKIDLSKCNNSSLIINFLL